MTALALRVFWVSLTTSAVLLPLVLLARPIQRRYRAGSCYLLWLVLALRLLVPVEIPLPQPAVTVELPVWVLIQRDDLETAEPGQSPPRSHSAALPEHLSTGSILALIWLGGGAAVLTGHLARYVMARKRLWRTVQTRPEDQGLLSQLGGQAPVLRAAVSTPMTLGLLRPVILLPFEAEEEDLPLILRHELCHIRRGDLWYKGLFFLCAAVHWFNPLVWKLGRMADETVELCCDQQVVAEQDVQFRRQYGQLLLKSAAGGPLPPLTAQLGGSDLKGRLMNLFVTKKRGAALICGALCAALCGASLVGCEVSAAEPPSIDPDQSLSIQSTVDGSEARDVVAPEEPAEARETWLWPVEGEYALSALHGDRVHPITGAAQNHNGVDIPAQQGTPVLAAVDGQVAETGFDKELGNYVLIAWEGGQETLYGQLSEVSVQIGDQAEQGQIIGAVGSTGMATGPHLHFAVKDARESWCDPLEHYPELTLEPWKEH